MYQQDFIRTDLNQGMHLHVHQCVCTNPLYSPYRQPYIPYVPQALPRPYNLAHYQYTSYNVPYTVPIYTQNAITTPIAPPEPLIPDKSSEQINATRNLSDEYEDLIGNVLSDDYTKYLEKGCNMAEKIAVRNQHRPCFKNIQNLCNRTKNEILKPSHTVSNIHSQGIPWATKDFIYAFIRLINCWHMLKGYIDAKNGTLGSIEKELDTDFKNCFADWEIKTKLLSERMIKIFFNLDKSVNNPSSANTSTLQQSRKHLRPDIPPLMSEPKFDMSNISNPIEHPQSREVREMKEEKDESFRRGESSEERDGYNMAVGSYSKIPDDYNTEDLYGDDFSDVNDDLPSPPLTIEFLETAKNVGMHYKRAEVRQLPDKEKEWKNAISASSSFIKKSYKGHAKASGDSNDAVNWSTCNNFGGTSKFMLNDPRANWRREDFFIDDQKLMAHPLDRDNGYRRQASDLHLMKVLLEELEKSSFTNILLSDLCTGKNSPENIRSVYNKFNCRLYKTPASLIFDLRRIIKEASFYFQKNVHVIKQVEEYASVLHATVTKHFPELSFDDGKKDLEEYQFQ